MSLIKFHIKKNKDLSIYAKRCLNAIIYLFQVHIKIYDKEIILNNKYTEVSVPYLKKMIGIKDIYNITKIESILMELQCLLIKQYNYVDKKNNKNILISSFNFITSIHFVADSENKIIIKIEFPNIVKEMFIVNNLNLFLDIDYIPILNKLKLKYSKKLYVFFKSLNNVKSITLTYYQISKILGVENLTTYKATSDMRRLLNRQLEELREKTEFKNISLKINLGTRFQKATYIFEIDKNKEEIITDTKKINKIIKKHTQEGVFDILLND